MDFFRTQIFFDTQIFLERNNSILDLKREYLVNILIMHERHFHFHSVVAGRLQDHPAACLQLWKESESAARVLLKC